MLPGIARIGRAAGGLFVVADWQNLGPHYNRTLMAWNGNSQRVWARLEERCDRRFGRMGGYCLLLSCSGTPARVLPAAMSVASRQP